MTGRKKLLQKPQFCKPKSKPKVFNPQKHCAICTRKCDGFFITLKFSYRQGRLFDYRICFYCNYRFLEAKESRREEWRAKIKLRLSKFVLVSPDGKPYRGDFARQGAK